MIEQLTLASATHVGGRTANADAAAVEHNPLGAAAAVVDGIGSSPAVVVAARRAAEQAAIVASHRGAQAGIMAAADTMPGYPGAPNAVAAVVSVEPGGRIEIAHVGDVAVWTWSAAISGPGLQRWTVDQTAGEHIAHLLRSPNLTPADCEALERVGGAVGALCDYVLNGLVYATISTISWTPLRGEHAEVDLILLTSDGVHKRLDHDQIAELIARYATDADALVEHLVHAAVTATVSDPDEAADNATAAVITLRKGQSGWLTPVATSTAAPGGNLCCCSPAASSQTSGTSSPGTASATGTAGMWSSPNRSTRWMRRRLLR